MQKFVRQAEFFTGALELGLSVVTIQTTMTEMNTAAKVKNAKATEQQAAANTALNKSLMNNPYVALAVGLVSVVAMLVIFERETGKVTDVIRALNKELKDLVTFFIRLGGIADNNPIKRLVESSSMKKLNDMTRLEVLGVG
jgi:alcohol dehydrogenase YqhD (iron-dependent ADH family)